jgi:hyperosmotically inducible periplasmic protein
MKNRFLVLGIALILALATAACNRNERAGKLDKDQVRAALDKAGYNDVKVDVDNDKGVVTLSGNAASPEVKAKAEDVAKSVSGNYVVANEIGIRPEGAESEARKVESNLDDAIKSDWKALVAANKWEDQHINADVKNGVLRLKGDVDTPSQRAAIEKEAAKLPHVQQVVNELDIKSAKGKKKAAPMSAQE